jgi:hypothetical protein
MERNHARALIRTSIDQAEAAVASSLAMVRDAERMRHGLRDDIAAANERTARAYDRLRRLPRPGEID